MSASEAGAIVQVIAPVVSLVGPRKGDRAMRKVWIEAALNGAGRISRSMVFANTDQTRRARPAHRRAGRRSLGAPGSSQSVAFDRWTAGGDCQSAPPDICDPQCRGHCRERRDAARSVLWSLKRTLVVLRWGTSMWHNGCRGGVACREVAHHGPAAPSGRQVRRRKNLNERELTGRCAPTVWKIKIGANLESSQSTEILSAELRSRLYK
jgi:hypothetical protein